MTSEKKPISASDARSQVQMRPLPKVDAMLARLKLPKDLVNFARRMNHSLSGGFLKFGHVYKVTQKIVPNRSGALAAGDQVRFLGEYFFPYDNGLRLYFEHLNTPGVTCELEFEGNFPNEAGTVRMISDSNVESYFAHLSGFDPADQRANELREAEQMLRDTAEETARLAEEASEAATPNYRKMLSAIQTKHGISGPACNAVYWKPSTSNPNATVLDYKELEFGKTYVVVQEAKANSRGEIPSGARVIFLGAETRHGRMVTLAFEQEGTTTELVFYPTSAQDAAACQPMLAPGTFFAEVSTGLTPREELLRDLRDQFLELIQIRDAAEGGSVG